MQAYIKLCWGCHTECLETLFNHGLLMSGKHAETEHVKLMANCIQACQTCADFMGRNSKFVANGQDEKRGIK